MSLMMLAYSAAWGMASTESTQSSAEAVNYAAAREFHENLKRAHPHWFQEGVKAYYKEIISLTPASDDGVNRRSFFVTIAGQEVEQREGRYATRERNVSFAIDPSIDFDQMQEFTLSTVCNGILTDVVCSKVREEKVPALIFRSYNDFLNASLDNKLWWMRKVTFEGFLSVPDGGICAIKIESINGRKNPLAVRGIEITYREDQRKTNIFFDFVDSSNRSLNYFNPIFSCIHQKSDIDEKVYHIIRHKLYGCDAKDITYEIFDSKNSRAQWVPDNTGFYDQNRQTLVALPNCYSNAHDCPEVLVNPLAWVFEEGLDSFYEFDGLPVLADTNDYFYSAGDGSLNVTLPYKATFKEYLSEQNKTQINYVERVAKPVLLKHKVADFRDGHQNWREGLYRRIREGDRTFWHRMEDALSDSIIQFPNEMPHVHDLIEGTFSVRWPSAEEGLSALESKRWCDAAQRSFHHFGAEIRTCNKSLLAACSTWNKLLSLNLSKVKMQTGENTTWGDVLNGIASLKQLTELRFCHNSPITDFNKDYNELANDTHSLCVALGACLAQLKKLRELHLQGLWLRPHEVLGSGVSNIDVFSKEVAMLTGIINHNSRKGVSAVIDSICGLEHLQTLFIDGIPNYGSSYFSRRNGWTKIIGSPWWLITTPWAIYKRYCQGNELQELAQKYADLLAKMPSLRSIFVYAPGGNCSDYFSKFFRERIVSSRPARSALRVNYAVLGAE